MTLIAGIVVFVLWAVGALASISYALSVGATLVLGLVLWNSFFGFCMAGFLMLFWSREHWMG